MPEFIPYDKKQNSIQDVHNIQSLFNLITAKKQTLWKKFYSRYIFYIEDITDIHKKIEETISARHLKSHNYSITVKYADNSFETKTDITLFEKTSLSNKQIMSIDLDYDFLIELPGIAEPQTYKINISTISTCAIKESVKNRADIPSFVSGFLYAETGKYKIDYVDQTVANELSYCIERWFNQIKSVDHTKLKILQRYTTNFRFIFKSISIVLAFFYIRFYSGMFNDKTLSVDFIAYHIIVYYLVFLFVIDLSKKLGSASENFVDSMSVDSAFVITPKDIESQKIYSKSNKIFALKSFLGFIFSILSNFVAGYLLSKLL
jgi:hypothetical protein